MLTPDGGAPSEAAAASGSADFARRVTGEALIAGRSAEIASPTASASSRASKAAVASRSAVSPRPAASVPAPTKAEGLRRSAGFPLLMAALSGAAWAGFELARWSGAIGALAGTPDAGSALLGWAAFGALLATGAFALNTIADAALFAVATWRGRDVTDEQLRRVLLREVMEGRLDPNAAALVRPYRPSGRLPDFTFAFASRGFVFMRPELAATPWLMRMVLLHELHHLRASPTRGPPRGRFAAALLGAGAEFRSRAAELRGPNALKDVKVAPLERALAQAQTSLKLGRPFDLLVLNESSEPLRDQRLYEAVSEGAARVTALDADSLASLKDGKRRWRAVVFGGAARVLPERGSADEKRLEAVLKKLDSLHVLAERLVPRGAGAFKPGTAEARSFDELVERAQRVREESNQKAADAFQDEVRKLWRQIASSRLKGVLLGDHLEGLYGALRDHGLALVTFKPGEKGVLAWERLLRYWEAADGGEFKVTRVDLEDGGHALVLRKQEARVGLWLRPVRSGRITTSVPNAFLSDEGAAQARMALQNAGFSPQQLKLFDENDVVVRHVFGQDVGRQEIFVTAPRDKAKAIRRFVSSDAQVFDSQSNFEPHLMDAGRLHGVPTEGYAGEQSAIMWVDTGADATHEDFGGRIGVVDMVDEGPEDWMGHGTHVAGISVSGSARFMGMAKAAKGLMAKVFSRDQAAADGEIMAAGAVAVKRRMDAVNLSLGQRGSSADNLADYFSVLARSAKTLDELLVIVASAGNAGPFDKTLSQPGAGVDVISVAAAAKSLDDGRPEISFFSSVGPDVDRRFAVRRIRLKPDLTAIGGDVVSEPGSRNVYKFGVFSARSKDAARTDSDHEDGVHTGLSGTSMASPAVAAIAARVKRAVQLAWGGTRDAERKAFLDANGAFAVKSIMAYTALDLGAPPWFQGPGLVQTGEALKAVAESPRFAFLTRLLPGGSTAGVKDWRWIKRLKDVEDLEDKVFMQAELAKELSQSRDEDGEAAADEIHPADRAAHGNLAQAEAQRKFNESAKAELPKLLEALKDENWLVRRRAALVLMNFRLPAAVLPLSEAALHDSDPRVRQMAFFAIAETQSHAADALLRQASSDPRWDVGVYAAYALAKRGDRSAVGRIVAELGAQDKTARYTASWLLGQLGTRATTAEAEALAKRVAQLDERGNIRHLAAASLSNLADAAPEAISDGVVMDLLSAAGPDNLALTRTISKFFPVALTSKEFVARLRKEPLKAITTNFVLRHRDAITRPGALGELVQRLAKAAAIPLDAPTSPPDPNGAGVLGVDEVVGPIDLLAVPPAGSPAELPADLLETFDSSIGGPLPLMGGLWLAAAPHKLYALTLALEHRGWRVRRALPYYPLSMIGEPGGVVVDPAKEVPPLGPQDDLIRIRATEGVSELRVMAALEKIAAQKGGKGPALISLPLAAPTTRRTPLSVMVDRLVQAGFGVVTGAGNSGPRNGSSAAPSDAALAPAVAAASRDKGLQFYSGRGAPGSSRIAWAELVDHLEPGQALDGAPLRIGTGVAAERAATGLHALAKAWGEAAAAAGAALPEGWFHLLVSLVKRTAAPMPGHGPHEVGAGLADAERALAALRERLGDLPGLEREAAEAARAAAERASGAPRQ